MSRCPDVDGPILMDCPACSGRGCGACGDAGRIELTACVRRSLPDWTYGVFEACLDAHEGRGLPVGGGTNDQSASFMRAYRYVAAELRAAERQSDRDADAQRVASLLAKFGR